MAEIRVRDITPGFGAEIDGLDLSAELDEATATALRQAFDERGLLVFRGLDLAREQQAFLADTLIGYPLDSEGSAVASLGEREPAFVSNRDPDGYAPFGRLLFHSDMMWSDQPFQVLSLYGVEIEQPNVPTTFASTTNAWDTLPSDLRARVEGLHAVHVTGQQNRGGDEEDELLKPIREREASTTTSVAHPHPRTGRTMLYVSQMMTRDIVELEPDDSEALLAELFAHLYGPANTWDHEWRAGDLVAWDNQAIQHSRKSVKIDGPARTLRKVISPMPTMSAQAERPRYSAAN